MSNVSRADLVGQTFRNWLVLGPSRIRHAPASKVAEWFCRCDCGQESWVCVTNLCYRDRYTHCQACRPLASLGQPETYKYWAHKRRQLCSRWQSFKLFLEDMGPRNGRHLCRDRWKLPYGPDNAKWFEGPSQPERPSLWKYYLPDGTRASLKQLGDKIGVSRQAMLLRAEKQLDCGVEVVDYEDLLRPKGSESKYRRGV